jgi:adenylate cyclase
MALTQIQRHRLHTLGRIVAVAALGGGVYGMLLTEALATAAPAIELLRGLLRGLFTGALVSALLGGFEMFAVNHYKTQLRRLRFLQMIAAKGIVYTAIILAGDWLGGRLFEVGGDPGFGLNRLTLITLIVAIGVSIAFNFVMEMAQLLGPGVLGALMLGHYRQPRREKRLFVFFDMRGSTALAERIGDIAFHRLLNRFFIDLTEAVLPWRGIVHKYVGDEMIVTWPLDGRAGAAAAGAALAIAEARARLRRGQAAYLQEFGVVPDFRAVLHAGPVVTGEMGEVKREIVLLGDTVNTTARIELIAKGLDSPSIASAEALEAISPLPDGIATRPLGSFPLPGKTHPVTLYAIESK